MVTMPVISIERTDVKKDNIVVPGIFNVSSAIFCTKISNDFGISISTIEHLMAALYGLGIELQTEFLNKQQQYSRFVSI